jgi:hypothetical protein
LLTGSKRLRQRFTNARRPARNAVTAWSVWWGHRIPKKPIPLSAGDPETLRSYPKI